MLGVGLTVVEGGVGSCQRECILGIPRVVVVGVCAEEVGNGIENPDHFCVLLGRGNLLIVVVGEIRRRSREWGKGDLVFVLDRLDCNTPDSIAHVLRWVLTQEVGRGEYD